MVIGSLGQRPYGINALIRKDMRIDLILHQMRKQESIHLQIRKRPSTGKLAGHLHLALPSFLNCEI
jgi:hypothetical protein